MESQNVQAQTMPRETCNPHLQPLNYENQLPAAPAQSNLDKVLPAISNERVASMSILPPQANAVPQTTAATKSGKPSKPSRRFSTKQLIFYGFVLVCVILLALLSFLDTGNLIVNCGYKCTDGKCIAVRYVCNGHNDCSDGEDECACTSAVSKYRCRDDPSNTVISITQVCDGNSDCPGNADEERCIIMPSGNSAGQVQIYSASAGTYHPICGYGDGWTYAQSRDICLRLGYSGVVTSVQVHSTARGLKCPGSTLNLAARVQQSPSVCTNDKVMKIVCVEKGLCGLSSRIVGGVDTTITKYPWQISLQKYSGGSWNHFCGGTIVSDRWVVTAAHCVIDITSKSIYRVVAGITTLSETIATGNAFSITKIVPHPLYDKTLINMDIALIYVSTNFAYCNTVKPACMPAIGQIFADYSAAHITGWGSTIFKGPTMTTLQAVTVSYYNTVSCKSAFPSLTHYINESKVCAGVPAGGKGACRGDSGGPLVIRSDGRDYLAGVTSFVVGEVCAQRNLPEVYTKVSYFVDWIRDEFKTL